MRKTSSDVVTSRMRRCSSMLAMQPRSALPARHAMMEVLVAWLRESASKNIRQGGMSSLLRAATSWCSTPVICAADPPSAHRLLWVALGPVLPASRCSLLIQPPEASSRRWRASLGALLSVPLSNAGFLGGPAHLSQTAVQVESASREGVPGIVAAPLALGPPAAAEGSSSAALSHAATERLRVSGRPRVRRERSNKSTRCRGQHVGVLGPL